MTPTQARKLLPRLKPLPGGNNGEWYITNAGLRAAGIEPYKLLAHEEWYRIPCVEVEGHLAHIICKPRLEEYCQASQRGTVRA